MPQFQPFANQYSAHTDVTINPSTGAALITVAHHPDNKNGYNCELYELAPPYTGKPELRRTWRQGEPGMLGPFGHGASVVLPNGALLIVTPLGIESGANVAPTFLIEPGYAVPYRVGPDEDLIAAVNQLQGIASEQENRLNAIETALGTMSQGGLDEGDREALNRLRGMLRL